MARVEEDGRAVLQDTNNSLKISCVHPTLGL
ncbi:MAG: hypothetical protein ACLU4N_12735 [Butyricimonas faecihominis]